MPPRNRNYHLWPIQSDRTSYGYGHTDLETSWVSRHETLLTMLVVFAGAFVCGLLAL